RAYCLKTQPATGETYPKSDLFNKAYCQYTSYRYGTLPCPSWHNNINQRLFKPTPQMHFFMN
ncbi:hypothetical protein, partial [Escherichia coli]